MSFLLAELMIETIDFILVNMAYCSMAASSPKKKKHTKRTLRIAEARIIVIARSSGCERFGDERVGGGSALLEACRRVMLEG